MSEIDEPTTPADERPAAPRTPGAQAASRARRIGGRPSPGPRPGPSADEDAAVESAVRADTLDGAPGAGLEADLTDRDAADRAAPSTGRARKAAKAVPAEPAAGEDAEVLRRRLDRLRWVPAVVAGVAVAALAVTLVVLSHGTWWAKPSPDSTRDEVLAAAKTCLAKTNSYDYRKLDEAEAAGLGCATGKFRDSYKQSMETVVKKLAPERKATQEVQVNKAGVESVSKDGKQWVVLIYGQQKVTNTTATQPRFDLLSARVTMDKVGDQWLISALSAA